MERGLSWVIPASFLLALVAAYALAPGFRGVVRDAWDVMATGDLQEVRTWLRGFGPWSLAVILGILVAQPLLLVVPSVFVMVVAVLAYGPLWGGLLALGGSTFAAMVGYGIGWTLSPVTVEALLGERMERRIEGYVERYGFWAVALFRVSPVLSTDAISVVAGLLEMHPWRYLAATILGFLPLVGAIAILGGDLDRMESVLVWGSAASLGIFAGYVAWDRWRRRRS